MTVTDGQGDLSAPNNGFLPPEVTQLLPPVPEDDVPPCGYPAEDGTFIQCTEERKSSLLSRIRAFSPAATISNTPGCGIHPRNLPPSRSAAYSNTNYALLGLVLSRMTNKPLSELFATHLVGGLNLTGASYTVPSPLPADAIVPVNTTVSGWDSELGIFPPLVGNFASTSDLANIGRTILKSSLLPQSMTRRWLTPHSFVNGLDQGVGMP